MNKKGDISMTMLVFIALASCLAVLFVFLSFNSSVVSLSKDSSSMINEIQFAEKYIIAESAAIGKRSIEKGGDVKNNFVNFAAERDASVESFGNFFGKVRNNEFVFEQEGEGFVLEFQDLFVLSQRGINEMKRNFNLKIDFDNSGNVRKIYK